MKYAQLGNSDLTVSRICMGCMGFGDAGQGQHAWTLDEEHSREIIRHGLEMGINFYDTAIAYQSGTSEQYVGRALRDFAKRDDVTLATKFLPRTPEEMQKAKEMYEKWAVTVTTLGGTVSAEHGTGKIKAILLAIMYGGQGIREMAAVRRIFDPQGMLARGNLFPL